MKITTVTVANFKGLSERFDLKQFNLFVGPNGSGKTARVLALRYAIAGTTPFGARPEDAFKLCSADRLRAHVLLDDGFTWTRAINRDPRRKTLQTEVTVVGRSELGMRESSAAVAEHVGTFAAMFNLGVLLDLSSDKSRDYVLDLCADAAGVGSQDPHTLRYNLLKEFYAIELGPGTVRVHIEEYGQLVGDIGGLKAQLGTDKAGYLDEVMKAVTSGFTQNPAESLAEALRLARVLTNGTKQNKDRAQQAARKLSERKAEYVVAAGSAADLDDHVHNLTAIREEIVKQLEHQAGRDSARVTLQRYLEAATSRLIAVQKEAAELAETPEPDLAEADTLEAEAKALDVVKPEGDLETIKAAVVAARDDASDASTEKTLHAGKVVSSAAAVREAEASLKRAKESPWQKALDLAEGVNHVLKDTNSLAPAGWNELRMFITKNATLDNIPDLEASLAKVKETVRDVDHRDAELTTAVNEAEEALAGAEEMLRAAEAAWKTYERHLAAHNVTMGDATRIREDHKGRDIILGSVAKRIKECTGEQVGAQKLLNELDAAGGHINVDDLREQQKVTEGAIVTTQAALEDKQSYAVLETELTKCIAQAERDTVLHALSKSMCDAIRALRERLMERMVSPLLDRLNAFLDVAAPGRKAYCDLYRMRPTPDALRQSFHLPEGTNRGEFLKGHSTPTFELGWIVSNGATMDKKVPLPALSSGETALFGAGLAFALVSLAEVPLKLLLLEAGEVDAQNLKQIMRAISEVGGDLSNVLIAAHADPKWMSSGWNIVRLGARE